MRKGRLLWYDVRAKFWHNQKVWPNNSSRYIFLGNAVQSVGFAMFPDEWTEQEPATVWRPPLPPFAEATLEDIDYAQAVLLQHDPWYRAQAAGGSIFLPLPTQAQWDFAKRLSIEASERAKAAFDRFVAVVKSLIDAFESGLITTGARAPEGGRIYEIDASIWNGETVASRFRCCRISAADPFSSDTIEEGGYLLYVEREALKRFNEVISCGCDNSLAPETVQQASFYRSPYLEFMNDCAESLKIDPDNPPKIDDLKASLRATWPSELPELSDRHLGVMATFLRPPEAQRGGARPQTRTAKRVA